MPGVDEVAQPLSRERVYLVVVSGHGSRNEKAPACGAVLLLLERLMSFLPALLALR